MGATEQQLALEPADPLIDELTTDVGVPERTYYEAGVMLNTDDFRAEQDYQRGRLARVMSALHGYGTLAGLGVNLSTDATLRSQVHLAVSPGLGLDRYGRLIELRREQCITVADWLTQQATQPEEKRQQILDDFDLPSGQLTLAVQLRFAACNHGVTPAFASGPFNATDYVVPSRVADAFEIVLVPRRLGSPAAQGAPFMQYAQLLRDPPADPAALHAALAALVIQQQPFPRAADANGESFPWLLLAHITLPARQATVNGQAFIEIDTVALAALTDDAIVLNGVRPLAFNFWQWQDMPL